MLPTMPEYSFEPSICKLYLILCISVIFISFFYIKLHVEDYQLEKTQNYQVYIMDGGLLLSRSWYIPSNFTATPNYFCKF